MSWSRGLEISPILCTTTVPDLFIYIYMATPTGEHPHQSCHGGGGPKSESALILPMATRDDEVRAKAANATHLATNMSNKRNGGGGEEEEEEFDPSSKPPFGIGDIRNAIPKHCWVKDPWRSMSYVFRDFAIAALLAAAMVYADRWFLWPLYWATQGTMFWAIFVLGHDCGHGSFSDSKKLNSVVGHVLHSFILVPYNGWRISHRTHHQNHGHVENDESWHPTPESLYKTLDDSTLKLRFTLPFPLFAYPVYLLWRTPGKSGSHFHPYSKLFAPNERLEVVISTASWGAMAVLLAGLSWVFGPITMLKLYFFPLWVFIFWLDLVTYLHHHGHEKKLPWYRGKEWSYLRGALTTLDRDYGVINNVHHNIETHVVHHLFPQIPHYHLVDATKAAKPVLGKYYRQPEKSAVLPFHLLRIVARSLSIDHFVSDDGDIVYYQNDPRLSNEAAAAAKQA